MTLNRVTDFGLNSAQVANNTSSLADIVIDIKNPPVPMIGAKGDGVTDDTQAINNINASMTKGGFVLFPLGTYKFTSQLTVPDHVHWIGQGAPNADIGSDAVRPTRLLKSGSFNGIILGVTSSIENMSLDGDTGNSGFGVQLNSNRSRLENVTVTAMGGDGVVVGNATVDGNRNDWGLINVISRANGGNGFTINDYDPGTGPDVNAGCALRCSSYGNSGDGWQIDNAQVNTFIQCYSEKNTGLGWHLKSHAQSNSFFNCGSEQNTAGNFTCDSGSANNLILGSLNYSLTDNGNNVYMKAAGGSAIQFLISQLVKIGIEGNRPTGIQKGVMVESNSPGYGMFNPSAPSNAKQWELYTASSGTLILRTADDSGNPGSNVFYITRNGTVPQIVRVPTGILTADGGIGVGNSAAASTLGTVVKKMQVFDATGNSLGYVPIYNSIT